MMDQIIKDSAKQFLYEPVVQNSELLRTYSKFIVAGMGGSNLAASLIRRLDNSIDITSHRNYGLPYISDPAKTLVIATSFSGDTEEPLDSYSRARAQNIFVLAIATGGKLIAQAQKDKVSHIQLPDPTIQPRMGTGYIFTATLKAMGCTDLLNAATAFGGQFKPAEYEKRGKEVAQLLKDKVPVVYASEANRGIAYNWKIKFNETGKIPAFYNVLPELNHNEMTGFDLADNTKALSEKFAFVILKDGNDHPRIIRRMEVLADILTKRNFHVICQELLGTTDLEKIFSTICIADWASYHTALLYDVEPEQVPLVEEFKKILE